MAKYEIQLDVNGENAYPKLDDSGWLYPTFKNGAANWTTSNFVRYRKIGNIVYIAGLMKAGSTGVQFTLPEGFRPAGTYNCWICRMGATWCRVHVNYSSGVGDVVLEAAEVGAEVPLSPISFIAEQ